MGRNKYRRGTNLYNLLLILVAAFVGFNVVFSGFIINKQEPLTIMSHMTGVDNSTIKQTPHGKKISGPSSKTAYDGKIVDVLSVASKSRPEYVQTQRETWGNHALIRNFFHIDESIDEDTDAKYGSVCRELPEQTVYEISDFCRKKFARGLVGRFATFYAQRNFLKKKSNPAGWLCAQKRFPIGLARTIRGYKERGESLPDYLFIVDDDTYCNMDTYYSEIVSKRSSSALFVGAGCRVTNSGHNEQLSVVFPFGGFGLTFSKGSLRLLLSPLSKHQNPALNSKWQNSTIETIEKNSFFEKRLFHEGMNLAELMELFASDAPYQNFKKWKRGVSSYCYHGHWVLAIFTQIYQLHSGGEIMEAIQNSTIITLGGETYERTNLCNSELEHCHSADLVCHYQTPNDMKRLVSEYKSSL